MCRRSCSAGSCLPPGTSRRSSLTFRRSEPPTANLPFPRWLRRGPPQLVAPPSLGSSSRLPLAASCRRRPSISGSWWRALRSGGVYRGRDRDVCRRERRGRKRESEWTKILSMGDSCRLAGMGPATKDSTSHHVHVCDSSNTSRTACEMLPYTGGKREREREREREFSPVHAQQRESS